MESNQLVSVVMPTFNAGKYIAQALSSILNQSYSNIEVLIIDDGSTDSTNEYVKSIIDNRVRYHRFDHNRGVIFARNFAISIAKGEFIALMDSDDISSLDRIEKQVRFMNERNLGACGAFNKTLDESTGKIRLKKSFTKNADLKALLTIYCSLCNPVMMMRSSLAKSIKYKEEFKAAEDYAYWCEVALSGTAIANIPSALLTYRVHDHQISQLHKIEANVSFQKARANYVSRMTNGMLPPSPTKLSTRLFVAPLMIQRLKSELGSITPKAIRQIYAEFQFAKNGYLKPLIVLERWIMSILLNLK